MNYLTGTFLLLFAGLVAGCATCETTCETSLMVHPIQNPDFMACMGQYFQPLRWTYEKLGSQERIAVSSDVIYIDQGAHCFSSYGSCQEYTHVKVQFSDTIELDLFEKYTLGKLAFRNTHYYGYTLRFGSYSPSDTAYYYYPLYTSVQNVGCHTVPAGTFDDVCKIYPINNMDTLYWSFHSGPLQFSITDSLTDVQTTYRLVERTAR